MPMCKTSIEQRPAQGISELPPTTAATVRVHAIRRAAVRFANDYGPLPAANAGDEDAQHAMALRLYEIFLQEGLEIVLKNNGE